VLDLTYMRDRLTIVEPGVSARFYCEFNELIDEVESLREYVDTVRNLPIPKAAKQREEKNHGSSCDSARDA